MFVYRLIATVGIALIWEIQTIQANEKCVVLSGYRLDMDNEDHDMQIRGDINSVIDCLHHCEQTYKQPCDVVSYKQSFGLCRFPTAHVEALVEYKLKWPYNHTLTPKSGWIYLENCRSHRTTFNDTKTKVVSRVKRNARLADKCHVINDKVLLAFAFEVLPEVHTLTDCMLECQLNQKECRSGMYFEKNELCMLNTETKDSEPEFFLDEDTSTYFEECKLTAEDVDAVIQEPECKCPSSSAIAKNNSRRDRQQSSSSVTSKDNGNKCGDKDTDAACTRILRLGLCDRKQFIEPYCAKTCGYC